MDNIKKNGFIPENKNYKLLISYQKSVIIYDATVWFCGRFFRKYDRTIDQMVQAARSGKQNIIEGSMAAKTSTETEIKLTNVARASLEELLEDYLDFLRVKEYHLWEKNGKQASYVRQLSSGKIALPKIDSDEKIDAVEHLRRIFVQFIKTRPPDVCANIMVCLINQCNFLLDRQIRRLEKDFVKQGGLRERMFKARLNYRKN